jgi:ribosomal protein S18 acetylase RimI-like enzyme
LEHSSLDDNELQFFSLWSKKKVSRHLILLYNPNLLDDALFNHARLNNRSEVLDRKDLNYVKRFYSQLGIKPSLFLNTSLDTSLKHLIEQERFKVIDRLITFSTSTSDSPAWKPDLRISACKEDDADEWIRVFVEAFSTPSWLNELNAIVAKMLKDPNCTLYLARYKDRAVGVAARYSTNSVSGLYCLGTIPKLRNRGIGSALVSYVISQAHKAGDQTICLQTPNSEHLIKFYSRLGFKRRYAKVIYCAVPI